ncbi:hypothetical protein DXG01_009373, partial [Tephrocybe rancida]
MFKAASTSKNKNTEKFHPPRAPPDHLRLQSFQILSRLALIPAFRPWLHFTSYHVPRRRPTSLDCLFDCFAFGAPLGTLLTLLGSPVSGSSRHVSPDEFDFTNITREERERYFAAFVQRVQMLEAQGRLAYGEVLRSEDFLSGSAAAFGKVLRTVYRLLVALEETYPGIFVAPVGAWDKRGELMRELFETEKTHLTMLESVFDAVTTLTAGLDSAKPYLECFAINRKSLLQYHENLVKRMEHLIEKPTGIRWTEIFGLDDDTTRTKVFGAYRTLCINYLSLTNFLETTEFKPHLVSSAQTIVDHTSTLISRIATYSMILKDILDAMLPTDDRGYNSLCEAVLRMDEISDTMDEAGLQLRTMRATSRLKGRAYTWTAPDPEDLGTLFLDDCLTMDSKGSQVCSVFLFESMMLCCTEGFDRRAARPHDQAYPIYAWEMGPALRRTSPLDIMHAIPISKLDSVLCPDTSSMQITWVDKDRVLRHVTFLGMSYPQWEQWLTALEPFVPPIYRPSAIPRVTFDHEELLSEDEDPNGHMLPHARPWSGIARKGPRSESSSFVNQEVHDHFALISPGVLPTLFSSNAPEFLRSPSPMSLSHAVLSSDRPPTPPAEDGYCSPTNPLGLLDLTGMVAKQGRYASAHGGFSDVWKGVWHDGDRPRNVAVKVLRTKIDDPELEEKMIRRLRRELNIWKNLDHPHILSLLGTTSDFGHYSSMVCPWMENGSASKHMERCGDIMSTSDRLKL